MCKSKISHIFVKIESFNGCFTQSDNLIKEDNPALSLKNVCKWAHRMYQTDPPAHGRSPDYSIFLTKKNFGPAGKEDKFAA